MGNAMERFTEDALRIMRAIRFAAQLNFTIEEETWRALSAIAPNLSHVSKERIQTELTKTLLSGNPQGVLAMEETGMSPYMTQSFPDIFSEAKSRGICLEERLRRSAELPAEKYFRYGALLAHLGEKKTETILRELKLDNHTIRSAKTLAAFSGLPLPTEEGAVRRTMSQMEDWLFDAFLIFERNLLPEKRELAEQAETLCRRIRERGDCVRMKDMKVTGNDLMEAGVKPGKTVGETLARLFAEVLEDPQKNSREELLSIAFNG